MGETKNLEVRIRAVIDQLTKLMKREGYNRTKRDERLLDVSLVMLGLAEFILVKEYIGFYVPKKAFLIKELQACITELEGITTIIQDEAA